MKFSLLKKYPIRHFNEIIGQTNIISFIRNSLYQNIIHPLYLFSGMRGSGKTTLARLFSLALLCDKLSDYQKTPLVSIVPCYQCYSCQLYEKNKHPDIIELDAASHNGIDTIRAVIDNAYMLPVIGTKKIYIIDEVHMLSKAAFNACLKIMEEPPVNIHFILATTEIQKVIETIQSRSIILHFKPIPTEILCNYIKKITVLEHIIIDENDIKFIVELAEGSVRDSLNILNKLCLIDNNITHTLIINEYGVLEKKSIELMIDYILNNDIINYYLEKEKLLLAELGKKKCFQYAINHIQELLLKAYIEKNITYSIALLNDILRQLYSYEEYFFTSNQPLGIFDLLLSCHTNKSKINQTINNNTTIEENYDNSPIVIKKTTQVSEQKIIQTQDSDDRILIKNFLAQLETILQTIFSQGNIDIDHNKKILMVSFKKNFSFYKDFLLKKEDYIKEIIKKTFAISYPIQYAFIDDIIVHSPIIQNSQLESTSSYQQNNQAQKANIKTNDSINTHTQITIKSYEKKMYSKEKNTQKIQPTSPLLKKINIAFPGDTYLQEE